MPCAASQSPFFVYQRAFASGDRPAGGFGSVAADGHAAAAAGSVSLNTAALSHLVAGSLSVFGDDIRLSGPNSAIQQVASIDLDAARGITMDAGTGLNAAGADITLQAHDQVVVASIDVRSAGHSGTVTLSSVSGVISDADQDRAVNIHAGSVVMRGDGPLYQASQAAVVEVEAVQVNVAADHGMVVRDGGADGGSAFNLIDGLAVRQQLVAKGMSLREISRPDAMSEVVANATQFASWLSALQTSAGLMAAAKFTQPVLLAALPVHSSAADYLDHLGQASGYDKAMTISAVSLTASDMLSPQSYGLAERLAKSYLLGAKALQPFSSGLQQVGADKFDYWEESLVI